MHGHPKFPLTQATEVVIPEDFVEVAPVELLFEVIVVPVPAAVVPVAVVVVAPFCVVPAEVAAAVVVGAAVVVVGAFVVVVAMVVVVVVGSAKLRTFNIGP